MLELIVLGQVPGTQIYISFNAFMLAMVSVLAAALIVSHNKRLLRFPFSFYKRTASDQSSQLQLEL
jgi:hypothetical protein